MAHIRDVWTTVDKKTGKKTRTRRYGAGKRWQVRWVENGREVSRMCSTRDEAELYRSRVETGQADGTWITKDKADVTLGDLWDPWISSKMSTSEKTRRDYTSLWTRHIQPVWGEVACAKVQRAVIAAWIPTLTTGKGVKAGADPRPLSASAMRKIGIIIHAILDLAVEQGVIPTNPVRTSDLPKQRKSERRYLRVEEVDRLIAAAPSPQVELMLLVLLMTGLRPGEAKGLKVKDLDLGRGRLLVRRDVNDLGRVDETKTRTHREVPIGGDLLTRLAATLEGKDPEDWLLPDAGGKVWTTARWRRIWATLIAHSGIPGNLVTYELRHTAASIAIAAGADVKTVQLMLGHSSAVETLNTYGHLWEEGLSTIPGAMEGHLARERARAQEMDQNRADADALARRAGFRVV